MRERFQEFYPPDADEFDQLWSCGCVILDTNVLLNMYAYPKQSRELWLQVMELLRSRGQLWMPHQVGLEYQRNRAAVMMAQKEVYDKLSSGLAEISKIAETMDSYSPHPVIDINKYTGEVRDVVDRQKRRIDEARKKHSVRIADDPIRDVLDKVYGGIVGPPLDDTELSELYQTGERRYAAFIPPGFGDARKAEDAATAGCDFGVKREYGDLVLWEQVKRFASSAQCPIMIVTDDKKKGDWCWLSRTKANLGTHPLLKRELQSAAGQFLFVSAPDDFLEQASERLGIRGAEKAIAEVQLVDRQVVRRRELERDRIERLISVEQALNGAMQRCDELEQILAVERARSGQLAVRATRMSIDDDRSAVAAHRELMESRERIAATAEALDQAQRERSSMQKMYKRLAHSKPGLDDEVQQ